MVPRNINTVYPYYCRRREILKKGEDIASEEARRKYPYE